MIVFKRMCLYRTQGEDPVFILSTHLMSPAAELDYLKKVSELYILFLLPPCYSLAPMKYLLREILACKSEYHYLITFIYTTNILSFFYSSSTKTCN